MTMSVHNQAFAGVASPKVVLDFTTSTIDSRVTIARALNTATRANSSGYIEAVNANLPRFDYDPMTLSCNGLLIEESRTNLLTYTESFNSWSKTNATITSDAVASPANTTTADKLVATAVSGIHRVFNTDAGNAVNGATYTLSVYAKKDEYSFLRLVVTGFMSNGPVFDLSTGTVSSTGGFVATITPAANGFYRCTATFTATSTNLLVAQILAFPTSSTSDYTGDGISGIYIWGAQFEVGAFPTSYIPNIATGTTTRNADVATIAGTNFSDWWQTGRGSAIVRVRLNTVSGTRPWVQFDDTTADNIIAMRGNAANPELYIRTAGADQAQIDAGTIAANMRYRLAGAWAANDCAASINSGTPVLDGVATIPVVTQARLGSDGTNYLNGHLEAIEYYEKRVLSASLQVVSSTAGYRSIIGPVFRGSIIS